MAEQWRQHGRDAFKVLLPLWGLFIASAAALAWPLLNRTIYEKPLMLVPGAGFIALGFYVYALALPGFGKIKVSGLAELEPDRHEQSLITSGIRSRVRHPIYLGHLLEVIGWALATGSMALFALLAFALISGALMLHLEDTELETRFGEPYRAYRRTVPAIIPRF